MKKIIKICLILIISFLVVSVAWASFDYNAIKGYFTIDSGLKVNGTNLIIGTKMDPINGLMISHNLIFDSGGLYKKGGSLAMGEQQINITNINAAIINKNLVFSSLGGLDPMTISGALTVNKSLVIKNNGLSFVSQIAPPKAIYATSAYMANLTTSTDPYTISTGTTIQSKQAATVLAITYGEEDSPYCQVVSFDNGVDWANEYRNDGTKDSASNACDSGGGSGNMSQPSCCPNDNYVLSADVIYGNDQSSTIQSGTSSGRLLCCHAYNPPAY